MEKIAILGLGIIGGTWARHYHDDGFEVRGWNRSPKPDLPYFQPDILKAVQGADFIFIIVYDPQAVNEILEKIVPVLRPEQTVIQSSTISPSWLKKFAAWVETRGTDFLEAPFTGSKPAAEARKVTFYLGGNPDLAIKLDSILAHVSSNRLHIGPLGSASSLKLAMNLNIASVAAALSESLALARAEGVKDEIFFKALDLNVSKSGLVDLKAKKLQDGDFAPQFSLKNMDKDLGLALETAGKLNLPQTKNLKALYSKGLEQGLADQDFTVYQKILEN